MSAFVQIGSNNGAAITSQSVTLTMTAGNAVFCVLVFNGSKASLGTIAQTAGDTTSAVSTEIDSAGTYTVVRVATGVAGGSTTYTFTFNSVNMTMYAVEASTIASSPFDVGATTAWGGTTTHAIGATATLAQAVEFCLAIWNADGAGTTSFTSVDNGFTVPTGGNLLGAGINGSRALLAYLDTASTTGVTVTATTGSQAMSGLLLTFKTASATRGLFRTPPLSGLGIGASFFRDPLQGAGA